QFWALYFLGTVSKLDTLTTAYIVGAGLVIGTPSLIFFGWLSDHIGRKPVILGGMLIAAVTYYPLYSWLGAVTQPGNVNYPIAILIVAILVCYVGMVYGPIGAFLAEFFPGRIRYTSVSVPYHIGNGWGGGLVPFITTAAWAATGSLGYALIYPIAVPLVCFVLGLWLMPATNHIMIREEKPQYAYRRVGTCTGGAARPLRRSLRPTGGAFALARAQGALTLNVLRFSIWVCSAKSRRRGSGPISPLISPFH